MCQAEAGSLQETYEAHADDGLLVVTLLGQDTSGDSPGADDLATWADTFGLTHPVVADPQFAAMWELGGDGGLPYMVLVGEGAVVLDAGYFTTGDVEDLLAD